MSDPCPRCEAPLALDNTFCRDCGYELELAIADYEGQAAELEDEFDYERALDNTGLRGESRPAPWGALAGVLGIVVLALILVVWGAL